MNRIDIEKQQHYNEKVRNYELNVQKLAKKEASVLAECRARPQLAACKLFSLSEDMLNLTSNYLIINGISVSVINSKNEEALNEAKKTLSKAIIYLENIVTGKIDVPFSDYETNLAELDDISSERRLYIVKKAGITIDFLKAAYGDNSKWKWVFVDLEGKFAAVAKNLLNLKKAQSNSDPNSPDYEPILYHTYFAKQLLSKSAESFHGRFELVTRRKEDLRVAIVYLNSLRRLHILFGEKEDAESAKKKSDNWTAIMDTLS
ncbi:MAG: hypothetical protein LBV52_05435 [Spirochaetaceae bacterium]|nr:hypothetical protein [Spirochaetaceae bacterium]